MNFQHSSAAAISTPVDGYMAEWLADMADDDVRTFFFFSLSPYLIFISGIFFRDAQQFRIYFK